jgi:enoyl-[acyl-carrier protein] reductase II
MSDSGKSPCNSNRVCQILKIEKPVIQGPMFWLTDAKLVAGVSEAGGLGVLGPHAGQNSLPKDDAERAERMRAEIKKVKELTSKPFGINIIVTDKKPDVQLELMLKVVYEEKGNGFETVPRRVPGKYQCTYLHFFFSL